MLSWLTPGLDGWRWKTAPTPTLSLPFTPGTWTQSGLGWPPLQVLRKLRYSSGRAPLPIKGNASAAFVCHSDAHVATAPTAGFEPATLALGSGCQVKTRLQLDFATIKAESWVTSFASVVNIQFYFLDHRT